ncbi:hypothetical protein Mgra_00005997 [Meloidogyne graminicola]|uniref:Uncharacterized protein n=1 Tax=Meloidogyne graminicola TaxID=189291 RepID=A0A8S9ZM77_9BILA|nr:hypothetical protein Mgra_00005997 [Meloidogyne graminicola]
MGNIQFQAGFNWLNAKFNEINNRIDTITNHFNGLFRTAFLLFATILNQQRRMDQRMNDLEARVRNLERGRDAAGGAGVQVLAENLEAQERNVAANAARVQAGGVVENVEVEERQRASTEPFVNVEQLE